MGGNEWKRLAELLWDAAGELDNSIAGTALLGLSRLSRMRKEFDREEIALAASRLAEGGGAGAFARITAMQVCAQLGASNALPMIRLLAQEEASVPLRLSAIGALGIYGDAESKPLLNEILDGPADHLKPAARQTLRRIALLERQKAKELEDQREAGEWRQRNALRKGTAL